MKDKSFSKLLLIQESILIWVMTILAFICVANQYFGELPWLSVMVGLPWTAYGVSQAFYYNKSKAENTAGGIVYDVAIKEKDSEGFLVTEEQFFDEEACG